MIHDFFLINLNLNFTCFRVAKMGQTQQFWVSGVALRIILKNIEFALPLI